MEEKIELRPIYDTAQSFYKKAYYTKEENTTSIVYRIYSYNTLVAILEIGKNIEKIYNNKTVRLYLDNNKEEEKDFYSKTTLRHIKELIKQKTDIIRHDTDYAVPYYDKKNILHLYSVEILRNATKKELFEYSLPYNM